LLRMWRDVQNNLESKEYALRVPELQTNLFSVGKIINRGYHRDIRIEDRRGRNLRYRARERKVAIRASLVSLAH